MLLLPEISRNFYNFLGGFGCRLASGAENIPCSSLSFCRLHSCRLWAGLQMLPQSAPEGWRPIDHSSLPAVTQTNIHNHVTMGLLWIFILPIYAASCLAVADSLRTAGGLVIGEGELWRPDRRQLAASQTPCMGPLSSVHITYYPCRNTGVQNDARVQSRAVDIHGPWRRVVCTELKSDITPAT